VSRQASPSPVHKISPNLPASPAPSDDRTSRAPEDKALTAFAQLGALRLNARRGLISFFDRKNCYLLAEATKTLCLYTGQAELDEDSLCWGSAIFPKEQSLCNYTVNLPWESPCLPIEAFENHPSLVVNDLTKDNRFKNHIPASMQAYPFAAQVVTALALIAFLTTSPAMDSNHMSWTF
jgi:hypothetical protein